MFGALYRVQSCCCYSPPEQGYCSGVVRGRCRVGKETDSPDGAVTELGELTNQWRYGFELARARTGFYSFWQLGRVGHAPLLSYVARQAPSVLLSTLLSTAPLKRVGQDSVGPRRLLRPSRHSQSWCRMALYLPATHSSKHRATTGWKTNECPGQTRLVFRGIEKIHHLTPCTLVYLRPSLDLQAGRAVSPPTSLSPCSM